MPKATEVIWLGVTPGTFDGMGWPVCRELCWLEVAESACLNWMDQEALLKPQGKTSCYLLSIDIFHMTILEYLETPLNRPWEVL